MRIAKLFAIFSAIVISNVFVERIWSDTFGSGANTFDIDFVAIGNPGNAADTTGTPNPVGKVNYTYRMGKFEVSEQMISKANALGGLGITTSISVGPDKAAVGVTWNEGDRFINWLNVTSGSLPAYKFAFQPGEVGYDANDDILLWGPGDAGYDANNPFRNNLARYLIPSENEWYKAAYYDPTGGVYYDYPTGSNTAPTPVANGTTANTAVFNNQASPADITQAGGLSPYGTMAQGGNAGEVMENNWLRANDLPSALRAGRGGYWRDFVPELSSLAQHGQSSAGTPVTGLRISSHIPEPGTIWLVATASIGWLLRRRRH